MKTIAYLDCPTGISGDMCLGAILDAGVPLAYLQTHLTRLGLDHEFSLAAAPTRRQGLRALKAEVTLRGVAKSQAENGHHHHSHPHHSHDSTQTAYDQPDSPTPQAETTVVQHLSSDQPAAVAEQRHPRHLPDIEALITQANLPEQACHWSLAVFRQLAEAEAAVHGIPIDKVHFHEVGATDAIVDIVGTCLGLDYLSIDYLACSPLPTGSGRVKAAHGWLPVPAPAVLKLMEQRQIPVYSNGITGELVTPTGAAIVAALAQQFGDPPALQLHQVGLGAGRKDLPVANILRLWVGTASQGQGASYPAAETFAKSAFHLPQRATSETVAVLETQIDDMVPQAVGYLYERLFAAGALDVFTQPIGMKKSRPGLLITAICQPDAEQRCTEILFAETPTLGIRHQHQRRTVLDRELQPLSTPHGTVTMKIAYHPQTQTVINVHPEYEDCATLARRHGLPWQVIYQTALSTWYQRYV